MRTINFIITRYFAIWILLFCLVCYFNPSKFINLKSLIIPALGIIMLGMGMTLQIKDFKRVLKRPIEILIGVISQYTIMPLTGFFLAKLFNLDNKKARTLSIEIGMQNSGLGAALANAHFGALAALPGRNL